MFWLHGEDLPAGVGNERFCAMHLVYVAFFLAATVWYACRYRKLDAARRKTADRILGSIVLFLGLCEYGVTAIIGRLNIYTLPIHVCSLMFFLVPIHAWLSAARPGSFGAKLHAFLGAVIFHPGFPGAWAALLFPDWLYYPFWNYLSISGFLVHGCISVYGASVIVAGAKAPEPKKLCLRDFGRSMAFLLAGAVFMYFFDKVTETNYWFMATPGADSPFTGVYVKGGPASYLLAFLGVAAAVSVLWYGLRYLLLARRKSVCPEVKNPYGE